MKKKEVPVGAEITEEELIHCLKPDSHGYECGFDEVMLLLGDLCETQEARDLVEHYVDEYYRCFDEDCKYIRGLEQRVEELETKLNERNKK